MDDSFIYPEVPVFWKEHARSIEVNLLDLQGIINTPLEKKENTPNPFKGVRERIKKFGFSPTAAFI